jgi:tetratricopeptide (TPR) repeat protein
MQKEFRRTALNPYNSDLVQFLAGLACARKENEEATFWINHLRNRDEGDGTTWRYFESLRLLNTDGAAAERLKAAGKLQQQVEAARPAWPPVWILKGQIAAAGGDVKTAIAAYQRAVELGERKISVFSELIGWLLSLDRDEEADEYLRRVEDHVVDSGQLFSLQLHQYAKKGEYDEALQLARHMAKARPENPGAHVALGRVLMLRRSEDVDSEARKAFERAVELAPENPRIGLELFRFYLLVKEEIRAEQTLLAAAKSKQLKKLGQWLLLAQGYQILGNRDSARDYYERALKEAPDNLKVQWLRTRFLMGYDIAAAEQSARNMLDTEPESGPVRRSLALILASQGGTENWTRAQQLLRVDDEVDLRLKAKLFAGRGYRLDREKAVQIYESLVAKAESQNKPVVERDRESLCVLYKLANRRQDEQKQWELLVDGEKPSLKHLAGYVDLLIRHEDYSAAEQWLQTVESRSKKSFAAFALRVRLAAKRSDAKAANALAESFAERAIKSLNTPQQRSQFCIAVGNVLSAVDLNEDAGKWFQQAEKQSPAEYGQLAIWLAQQNRVHEAVDLCAQHAKGEDLPKAVFVLVGVLLQGNDPTGDDMKRANVLLDEAIKKNPDNVGLLYQIATLRFAQGDTTKALELYRRVIQLHPKHILARNNIAAILADDPKRRNEAREYVEEGLKLSNKMEPELIDTKGLILLYTNELEDARKSFEEVADVSDDPRHHMHLALALFKIGDSKQASEKLSRAEELGLRKESLFLTPGEQTRLDELTKSLRR